MEELSVLYNFLRFGFFLFFLFLHGFLTAGLFLEKRRESAVKQQDAGQTAAKVSIIIPIHNESGRMESLLQSLQELSAPVLPQIIFIDDRCKDNSPALLDAFAQQAKKRGIDCRIITLKENPGPNYKQFALSKGIKQASGDFFLFTDGDCKIPPNWVNTMLHYIQQDDTGVVIAPVFKKDINRVVRQPTALSNKFNNGFLNLYQCYDHIIRYIYLAGAAGLGVAGGGFGNNIIVRKKAIDAAGGYETIPPSPTEDASLISHIRRTTKYKIRAVFSLSAAVETASETNWLSFIKQTLRWNNGGLFSPQALTRFNYNLLMLIISAGIIALPFLPFFPSLWPLPAAVFITMINNTIAAFTLFPRFPKGGLKIMFGYFLCLLFAPFYFTFMTLLGYMGIRPKWKGNKGFVRRRRF